MTHADPPPIRSKLTQRYKFHKHPSETGWEYSRLNQLGIGCSTEISIVPTNISSHTPTQFKDRPGLTALADTGADLNFISSRVAKKLIDSGAGTLGKGRYRITDAFTRIRTFDENLTFKLSLNDLKIPEKENLFEIKAVIVDVPLLSDVIIGLKTIRDINLFGLLPSLVGNETTEETDKSKKGINWSDRKSLLQFPTKTLREITPYPSDLLVGEEPISGDEESVNEENQPEEETDRDSDNTPGGFSFKLAALMCQDIEDESSFVHRLANIREEMSIEASKRAYEREDLGELEGYSMEAIPAEILKPSEPKIPKKSMEQKT
jgi:hypothetical protein